MNRVHFFALILFGLVRFSLAQAHMQNSLADQYFSRGEALAKEAQHDSAIVYFQKAGVLYKKNENWQKYVNCYNKMGNSAWRTGAPDQAKEWLELALQIGKNKLDGQHQAVAKSYHNIGNVNLVTGDYDRALEFYQESVKINFAVLGKRHPELANTFNNIGIIYRKKGEYGEALKFYQKSLKIRLTSLGERHPRTADSYNNIGDVYFEWGDFDRALEFFNKSLSIQIKTLGDKHPAVATGYHNLGRVYWAKGDYDRALAANQRSLKIRVKVLGEQHRDVAESYLNIGSVYWSKGDYDRGLEFYKKSLDIKKTVYGPQHPELASTYNNIGSANMNKKEYDRALEYFTKSLNIRLQTLKKQHPLLAHNYTNIGQVYWRKANYEQALNYFNKALNVSLNTLGAQNSGVAIIYNDIGLVFGKKDDSERALDFHQKALNIQLAALGTHHPDLAATYNHFGNIYFERGDFARALKHYHKALQANAPAFTNSDLKRNPSLAHILSKELLLETLQLKARALVHNHAVSGNLSALKAAFSAYRLIVQLIDQMRSGYSAEGSKLFLAEKTNPLYEKAIQTALNLSRVTGETQYETQAFLFAEKAKAAVLWEALQDSRAKQFAGIPDSLLSREKDLRIDLAFYDTRIQEENLKKKNRDSLLIADFENRYFDLNRRYEQLIKRFESDFPQYYALKYQTGIVAVAEHQQKLDEQTTILEYFVGDGTVTIFTISKFNFMVTVAPRDILLQDRIEQLRLGITKNHGEGNYQLYARSAFQLYKTLIQPVEAQLQTSEIIIIPDGILNKIPFECLLTADFAAAKTIDYRNPPYLMNKFTISYAYSANLLDATTGQPHQQTPNDFLAFAPVFVDGPTSDSRKVGLLQNTHAPDTSWSTDKIHLPASKQEVLGIQQLFQNSYGLAAKLSRLFLDNKTRVYLENAANEDNFKKEQLSNYRYLHLATHGFANKNSPDLSGLSLARQSNSAEDGVLHLREIYNLQLNADLVVVSACESGAGKLAKGEGLIGLTRGFIYAGARNLVVSLWKVNDWSTADLMQDFYAQILEGKNKAQALGEAKKQLILSNPDYAKPYYWALFILIGK